MPETWTISFDLGQKKRKIYATKCSALESLDAMFSSRKDLKKKKKKQSWWKIIQYPPSPLGLLVNMLRPGTGDEGAFLWELLPVTSLHVNPSTLADLSV